MLIFDKSVKGRNVNTLLNKVSSDMFISKDDLRMDQPLLPNVSELEVVRHYTKLSQKNYSIDTNFYPLGSCTMKYNPKVAHHMASIDNIQSKHPLSLDSNRQGTLQCLYELQNMLKNITGMSCVSLTPMAGAQGEFAGISVIKAYHENNNDFNRSEIIVPDAAHGTNPATANMCGYKVIEVPTLNECGDIDFDVLKKSISDKTAGIMLTNPSTLGVFEKRIKDISNIIHSVGGLLYYDGANLNAIMGKVRPGDMGFDVMHLNLHKTFATPHGGGGPGSGPIAVSDRLSEYIPTPIVLYDDQLKKYAFSNEDDFPKSIGRLSAFSGNIGVLIRTYVYIKLLGSNGLKKTSEMATLNANYLKIKLKKAGFIVPFAKRFATHEFIISLSEEYKKYGFSALDFSKCLLDYGVHAPTMYFPLIVDECLLIEPTETETKSQLDEFIEIMILIREKLIKRTIPAKAAPNKCHIKRVDELKAAMDLKLTYQS